MKRSNAAAMVGLAAVFVGLWLLDSVISVLPHEFTQALRFVVFVALFFLILGETIRTAVKKAIIEAKRESA